MFIPAQKKVPFYVIKQTNNFFPMFLPSWGTFRPPVNSRIFFHFLSIFLFNFNCQHCPSTIPVVEDKSLQTQYQISSVPVEAKEVGPAAVKGIRRALPTMSLALARSCPRSRLCSQSVSRRLAAPVPSLCCCLCPN